MHYEADLDLHVQIDQTKILIGPIDKKNIFISQYIICLLSSNYFYGKFFFFFFFKKLLGSHIFYSLTQTTEHIIIHYSFIYKPGME